MVDNGVDFGFYINFDLVGFTNNGLDDAQSDEITEVFAQFGLALDYRDVCLKNGGYIDTWVRKNTGEKVEELYFENEEDAERVAGELQKLIDTAIKVIKPVKRF